MRQVYENQFEKIVSDDINGLQLLVHKSLFDDTLYNAFGQPAQGVLGTSFLPSYVSAYAASLAVGTGFYYDSTQIGMNPNFRMINAQTAIAVAFTTADATHNRIDLVCLAPNYIVTSTASRFVKAGGVGPIALQTINKIYQDSYTLQVVAGTPSASPAVPSLPAGFIPIAQALIHANTGLTGAGDITDVRTLLALGNATTIPASNSGHVYAIGSNVQAQLDELDAAIENLPAPTFFNDIVHGSRNFTVPSAAPIKYMRVRILGAGGGGGGIGNSSKDGGAGGASYWGTADVVQAGGGGGGRASANTTLPAPGQGGIPDFSFLGAPYINGIAQIGSCGDSVTQVSGVTCYGGSGGVSALGGAGNGQNPANGASFSGATNSGSGGGGASSTGAAGGGGASGGYCDFIIPTPTAGAVIPYTIGQGGTAGDADAGPGADGQLIIDIFYQ